MHLGFSQRQFLIDVSHSYRERRDEVHDRLQGEVLRMGAQAAEMVRLAVEAAVEGNLDLINQVIDQDDQIDTQEADILKSTVSAVALENPVASDLKFLMSTLGIVGEIEKVGDHAVKLARRLKKLHGSFPADLKLALHQMGEMARLEFSDSLRLYVEYDPEFARQIIAGDEAIDKQFSRTRDAIWERIRLEPSEVETFARAISVFQALEHVADHAVEIARRLRHFHEDRTA